MKTRSRFFLSRLVHFELRIKRPDILARLGQQVRPAPRRRNEFPALAFYQDKEQSEASQRLAGQQEAEVKLVDRDDIPGARKLHAKLDAEMHAAEKRWRYAPINLNLAGYHRKNVTGRGSAAVLRNPVRQPLD